MELVGFNREGAGLAAQTLEVKVRVSATRDVNDQYISLSTSSLWFDREMNVCRAMMGTNLSCRGIRCKVMGARRHTTTNKEAVNLENSTYGTQGNLGEMHYRDRY